MAKRIFTKEIKEYILSVSANDKMKENAEEKM